MNCKRCGKELPPDQEKYCPYCGLHKGAYSTPRVAEPKRKLKKGPRSALLSMISIALIIGIIFVVIPILRNHNKTIMLADIQTQYDYLKENFNQFTDAYTRDTQKEKLAFFSAAVAKFEKAYPGDDEIERVQEYLYEFTGVRPSKNSSSESPGVSLSPQTEYENQQIAMAKEYIIDFSGISVRQSNSSVECGLDLTWVNKSSKDITQVIMCFRALDKSGGEMTVPGEDGTPVPFDKVLYSTNATAGTTVDKVYLSVWQSKEVQSAKLVYIIITYADGSTEYLPERVCSELWG